MKPGVWIAVYVLVVALIGVTVVDQRACVAALPSCQFGSAAFAPAPRFLATRPLERNDRLAASDVTVMPAPPAGALPAALERARLVGRYLRAPVAQGRAVEPANLADEPVLAPAQALCLVTAELGAFAATPGALRPGRVVTLGCAIPAAGCGIDGEWSAVALVQRGGETRLLASGPPDQCTLPAAAAVTGMR